MTEETDNIYRDGTTPTLSVDGSRLLPRHVSRELFPSSWLRRKASVLYDGGDITGTLLDTYSVGLAVATTEGKTLVSWEAIKAVELQDD
ncbi:MAG: hypothetical protein ACFB50_11895 [Rubrobacteraceae bacterium]